METSQKLQTALFSVIDQCKETIKEQALQNGPGMSIFKVLEDDDKEMKIRFFYVQQESTVWKDFVERSPNSSFLNEQYDPMTMFMVGVHIPSPSETDSDLTVGVIKLLRMDFSEVAEE